MEISDRIDTYAHIAACHTKFYADIDIVMSVKKKRTSARAYSVNGWQQWSKAQLNIV